MTHKLIEDISRRLDEGKEGLAKRLKSYEYYHKLPLETSPLYVKYVDPKLAEVDLSTLEEADGYVEWPTPSNVAQIFYNGERIARLTAEGVKLCTIREIKERVDGVDYGILPFYENKFSALIQALYTSGHILIVGKNTVIEEPIHLVSLVDRSLAARNLIILGEGAEIKVVEEIYSPNPPKENVFYAYSNEIELGENASLELTTIQAAAQPIKLYNIRRVSLRRNASLDWVTAYLGGAYQLARVEHQLADEYASVKDTHIALLSSNQVLDLTTDLLHQSQKTSGSVVARVALKDNSKAIAKGIIKIPFEGKQSNAYLSQHAIMLSPGASGITIPGLEILTNDVRATHSSSVSQLDEEQIFYMMSRGLDKEEAIKMITLGFFEQALVRIKQQSIKEGVHQMLQEKWRGRLATFKQIEIAHARVEKQEPEDIFEGHYKYR